EGGEVATPAGTHAIHPAAPGRRRIDHIAPFLPDADHERVTAFVERAHARRGFRVGCTHPGKHVTDTVESQGSPPMHQALPPTTRLSSTGWRSSGPRVDVSSCSRALASASCALAASQAAERSAMRAARMVTSRSGGLCGAGSAYEVALSI